MPAPPLAPVLDSVSLPGPPAPPSTLISLDAAENSSGTGGATVSRKFANGDNATVPTKLNRNACMGDLLGRYVGGMYGVVNGLTISIGTGLNLAVAAGHALIDGIVEVASATVYAVPPSLANAYIWLKQDGTLTHTTTTTPPAGNNCYIGWCTTSGSAVTAVDMGGVIYFPGGIPTRAVSDAGRPADTPSGSLSFFTRTAGGLFYWDGVKYRLARESLAINRTSVPSGDTDIVPAGYQAQVFDSFTVSGALSVLGVFRVVS